RRGGTRTRRPAASRPQPPRARDRAQGGRGGEVGSMRFPLRRTRTRHGHVLQAEHALDRLVRNVEHGRFERALSGLTAVSAVITGAEIWLEHDSASFSNRMMWLPVAL